MRILTVAVLANDVRKSEFLKFCFNFILYFIQLVIIELKFGMLSWWQNP